MVLLLSQYRGMESTMLGMTSSSLMNFLTTVFVAFEAPMCKTCIIESMNMDRLEHFQLTATLLRVNTYLD